MGFNDNKPIYLQLADQIMDEVESSSYHNGRRIPSVREYAAKAGVNANTVMRTYSHLQQEGIIYNQRGIGYFYAQDARDRVMKIRRKAMLECDIYEFMDRLMALQISPEEFGRIYSDYLEKKKIPQPDEGYPGQVYPDKAYIEKTDY